MNHVTELSAIYQAYYAREVELYEALCNENKALATKLVVQSSTDMFLGSPTPLNFHTMTGAALLYQRFSV